MPLVVSHTARESSLTGTVCCLHPELSPGCNEGRCLAATLSGPTPRRATDTQGCHWQWANGKMVPLPSSDWSWRC